VAGHILWGRLVRCLLYIPTSEPGNYNGTSSFDIIEINGADDPENPGLQIVFKISKSTEKNPNPGEVTIYNLSPEHRAALQGKGRKVAIEAGYEDSGVTRLFLGDVRTCDHVRDGANWKTQLKCGDGERAVQFARISESFAAGTTVGDVVKACARSMGLAIGNTDTAASGLSTVLYNGWTAHGPTSDALTRILRSVGYSYSIQDGAIQILAPGQTLAASVPVISTDTGMVGSPEVGTANKPGGAVVVKVKCLLQPQLRPGARFKLESERYNGFFRVKKVEHEGNIRGGEWYSSTEATSIA